jgi:hypothetical protein
MPPPTPLHRGSPMRLRASPGALLGNAEARRAAAAFRRAMQARLAVRVGATRAAQPLKRPGAIAAQLGPVGRAATATATVLVGPTGSGITGADDRLQPTKAGFSGRTSAGRATALAQVRAGPTGAANGEVRGQAQFAGRARASVATALVFRSVARTRGENHRTTQTGPVAAWHDLATMRLCVTIRIARAGLVLRRVDVSRRTSLRSAALPSAGYGSFSGLSRAARGRAIRRCAVGRRSSAVLQQDGDRARAQRGAPAIHERSPAPSRHHASLDRKVWRAS